MEAEAGIDRFKGEAEDLNRERDELLELREVLKKAPPVQDADARERDAAIRYLEDEATRAAEKAKTLSDVAHALAVASGATVEST